MTRKDYQAIAGALSKFQHMEPQMWLDLTAEIANVFAEDNKSFDPDRFFAACEGE
jgi:hypothetical protein